MADDSDTPSLQQVQDVTAFERQKLMDNGKYGHIQAAGDDTLKAIKRIFNYSDKALISDAVTDYQEIRNKLNKAGDPALPITGRMDDATRNAFRADTADYDNNGFSSHQLKVMQDYVAKHDPTYHPDTPPPCTGRLE